MADELSNQAIPQTSSSLRRVPLSQIRPSKRNTRKIILEDMVEARRASMAGKGPANPIILRPLTDQEKVDAGSSLEPTQPNLGPQLVASAQVEPDKNILYEIVDGEIRYRAALKNGDKEIDAYIKNLTPDEAYQESIKGNRGFKPGWFEDYLAMVELKKIIPNIKNQEIADLFEADTRAVSHALQFIPRIKNKAINEILAICKNPQKTLKIDKDPIYRLNDLSDPEDIDKALPVVIDRQFTEPQVKGLVAHIQAGGAPEDYKPVVKPSKKKGPPKGGPGPGGGPGDGGTPAETITAVTPDKPGEVDQKAKTGLLTKFNTWVLGVIAGLGPNIAKLAPKSGKEAFKLFWKFLTLPHRPCKYLANKMVPVGHPGGSHSSHSHSGSGVSLILLARHWGLYLLMLPFSYLGVIAVTGFLVGHLLTFTRAWFDHLTGYLVHLLFGQVILGLAGQALHEPVTALILGGTLLWLLYETARPPRGVLFGVAAVLVVAWLFRGWWMGVLHVTLPSGLPTVSAPAQTTPAPSVPSPIQSTPKASLPTLRRGSGQATDRRRPSKVSLSTVDRRPSTTTLSTYIPSKPWSATDEDRDILDAELAVFRQPCRIVDCPVTVDSAMGEGMATGRLQDLADPDKYILVQGHDKKQIQSVQVGATGLTLNLPGDALGNLAGNFLGVGASPAKTAFFWEDVRAIHCSKIETVSDHPGTSYYCGVVASSLKKPFMVQCAGAQTMEHLVSAMEFFIQKAQGGHGVPIGGVPYINQGVRLDDQGRPAVMWDNSPVAEAFGHATGSEPFGFRIWGVDYDADAQLNREKLEAGLQGLAPGKHNLYVVTPQDWDKARRSEDFQSDETPNPERRLYQLLVP